MDNLHNKYLQEEEDNTLAGAMKRGQQKISETATKGDPAQPLDSQAAQYYLDQIRTANDQYSPTAPPESRKALASALTRAEQLYKDQATKNEWLEVAQLLGRVGTQFAAAQAGMSSGRNMANLDMGPTIDYNARTERARRDYNDTIRNVGEQQQLTEREYQTTEKSRLGDLDRKVGAAEKGLSAALREEEIRRRETADEARDSRNNKAAGEREDKSLRAQQLRDLEGQEKDLAGKIKARQTLVNMLQQEDDLSSKSVSKLQEKYGSIAAQGDVDLSDLLAQLDKQTKPGTLNEWSGGFIPTTDPDKDKQTSLLKEKVDEMRSLLDVVRQRKQDLLKGKSSPAPAPQQDSPGATGEKDPPPPKTKRVQGPSGQVVEFPVDIADKYLSKPGYKEVK